ncbi:MAG: sugar transferase [Cytophagales bacterium]|nr:sugar transferase [Cytophagales bacterium]
MYQHFFKRSLDLVISILLLIATSPVFIVAALLLAAANQGKMFFVQKRPGLQAKPFYIIKFKTMNDKTDRNGNLLPDNKRLTFAGKIIRKTSIDELPQLLNVLKGNLSLIGPRPLLMEYLPLYSKEQAKRHLVKPGITGWAQVNGRNAITWEKKFEYDIWYAEHISFCLDVKIFFITIFKILKMEGIRSVSSATMEKFKGSSGS